MFIWMSSFELWEAWEKDEFLEDFLEDDFDEDLSSVISFPSIFNPSEFLWIEKLEAI